MLAYKMFQIRASRVDFFLEKNKQACSFIKELRVVAHPRIFRLFMKGKIYDYVL